LIQAIPYCGTPPVPGELLTRFNLDWVLIVCLVALTIAHLSQVKDTLRRSAVLTGWFIASAALISPLCAFQSRSSLHAFRSTWSCCSSRRHSSR
jgi:putative membrane protein